MVLNNSIFTDLSTYSPEKSISFYEKIFGWKYHKNDDYYIAYLNNKIVAGLYDTPNKFKQMRMPHFWMTYFEVKNVEETVTKAKKSGGIIEISSTINGLGTIALIRDPQGAGFTIYEEGRLKNVRTQNTPNTLLWNELHVSNANKVLPFYQEIFDWQTIKNEQGVYTIFNHKNQHIIDILEISNQYKGKYEYWVCTFGVQDIQETKNKIIENYGAIIIDEGNRILCTDNSNEAFFYIKEV
ncbi:VOC family protein [Aquimarina aquimarini]|uniref:VOC family protein n=1 Tax=Aquimarina aquimarini TaxID=1191734 RepID=UPI001F239B52|nr:VOC family protein [Aquimarina aquimarini]